MAHRGFELGRRSPLVHFQGGVYYVIMIIASAAALDGVGSLGYIPGLKVLKIFCLFIIFFFFFFICINVYLFIKECHSPPQADAKHTALVQLVHDCSIDCDMIVMDGKSQMLPESLSR